MQRKLKSHAEIIYKESISKNMPNEAVERAIKENYKKIVKPEGKLTLIAIGKAGWEMAKTANSLLGDKISNGVVITKYGHAKGRLGCLEIYEAGHPVVDFNGISATKRALELTSGLNKEDTVLFLVSGGGSALFESPACSLDKMQALTADLLKCGANINEINAVRKHISQVKGGKFACHVYPARVFSIVLSDVVGDDLSTIASGPACADTTTSSQCIEILRKYSIDVSDEILDIINQETPKEIVNATHVVSGSVTSLCQSAKECGEKLGYRVEVLDSEVTCDAGELAEKIGCIIKSAQDKKGMYGYIFGGEVTVKVKGNGKGGRNQELALLCADKIKGCSGVAVFCVGSDGTDGPTDAAGGYVDGYTWDKIKNSGKSPEEYLKNNNSYEALSASSGLIFTGPTGTNVNDLYMILVNFDK